MDDLNKRVISNQRKLVEGPCESLLKDEPGRPIRDNSGNYIRCGKPGTRQYDNSLDSGIHCQSCWYELVSSCRQRSW